MSQTPAARGFLIFTSLVIGAVIAIAALLLGIQSQTQRAAEQSKTNEKLLEIVLAVTGCTEHDTPEQCHQRIIDSSEDEGRRRIQEVDCRLRRALAGKPAPEPNKVCTP